MQKRQKRQERQERQERQGTRIARVAEGWLEKGGEGRARPMCTYRLRGGEAVNEWPPKCGKTGCDRLPVRATAAVAEGGRRSATAAP
jgi:hypothetical protein